MNSSTLEDESNIDYALCLANRCAAFLQLKLYEHCLTDIDLAIKHNYPESKRRKLLERKSFCLEQLKGDRTTSTNREAEAIDRELINLTNTKVNQWPDEIVALQDLHPGEIVLEENAFCKTLVKQKYFERCFNCLRKTDRYVYPCRGCSQIKFCTERCSEQAWTAGHRLECNRIAMLDLFKSNYSFETIQLALKCLIGSDLNRVFTELRNSTEQEAAILLILNKLQQDETQFKEDDYASVAQIVTYLVDVHEIPKNLIKSSTDNSADIELFGAILSRLLNVLQSNTVSILLRDLKVIQLRNCPHSQVYHSFEETEIGKAIFPIYNQLKHDLEPNCQILKFSNNKLIISALKTIRSGEELTINKQLNSTDNSLPTNQNLSLEHNLSLELYRENKSKYLKLLYRYAYKCFKCSGGPMFIFNESDIFYLECLKCEFNEQVVKQCNDDDEQPDRPDERPTTLGDIQELINVRDFCVRQSRKSKLLLFSKQPDLRTVEHNLLESYRDLRTKLFATNLCLAELEFDLSLCYIQMRLYLRAIKHATNAINSWKSHFTPNEIRYLNGLIKLVNVQYYFVEHINTTNKELDDEHIGLYNYNLNDLRENLKFLIENTEKFVGDPTVQQNLLDRFTDKLTSIQKLERK